MSRCVNFFSLCRRAGCCIALLFSLTVSARTIEVPGTSATLQAALDIAVPLDTIRVIGGVHAPAMVRGKDSIVLAGENSPRITRGASTADVAALGLRKCKNWVISGFVTDSTFVGILIDSCQGFVIENNRCSRHDERASFHGVGIKVTNSSDIIIRRNVVVRNEYIGITITGNRITIINNTVGRSAGYEAIFVTEGTTTGVDIINNILFSNNQNTIEYGYGAVHDGRIQYNILWKSGASTHCVKCTLDSTNIIADPLFLDADNDDYRLTAASPAIDGGDPDLFDPDSSRSDIGAIWFDRTGTRTTSSAHATQSSVPIVTTTQRGFRVRLPHLVAGHPFDVTLFDAAGRRLGVIAHRAGADNNTVFIPKSTLPHVSQGAMFMRIAGKTGQGADLVRVMVP